MDEAVQKGTVQPGRYIDLNFDFSRVNRSRNMNKGATSLNREINRGLLDFKRVYGEALGESFALHTSNFLENDLAGNLADLVGAVNYTLQGIHDKGEKDNPLWDTRGVCLFWTTTRYNAC